MNHEDLPSDSDASDGDYIPSDAEAVSEEDSNGEAEEGLYSDLEEVTQKGKKRSFGSSVKKSKKSMGTSKEQIVDDHKLKENLKEEDEKQEIYLTPEEEKKKADSLWDDFVKDLDAPPVNGVPSVGIIESSNGLSELPDSPMKTIAAKKETKETTITEIFEFAGEEVRVEKKVSCVETGPVRGRGRGRQSSGSLSSLVGKLGRKGKLSTLDKSKLDWDRFKSEEGIADDIQKHNKGKDGYLERQDFLQRTDLRQFEIEKDQRTSRRSYR